MPTVKCPNSECSLFNKKETIHKLRYVWEPISQTFIMKDNCCPECNTKRVHVKEIKKFSEVNFSAKYKIKGGPPKKGDKFYY